MLTRRQTGRVMAMLAAAFACTLPPASGAATKACIPSAGQGGVMVIQADAPCALTFVVVPKGQPIPVPPDRVVPPPDTTVLPGYQPPNLLANASFEQGWDGFTD